MSQRMNPIIKAEWVRRLRSDEYEQGGSVLTRTLPDGNEKHCCLGILCVMAVEAGVARVTEKIPASRGGASLYDGDDAFLPGSVIAWAGLDAHNPMILQQHVGRRSLGSLNDSGTPFSRIADLIEEHL